LPPENRAARLYSERRHRPAITQISALLPRLWGGTGEALQRKGVAAECVSETTHFGPILGAAGLAFAGGR